MKIVKDTKSKTTTDVTNKSVGDIKQRCKNYTLFSDWNTVNGKGGEGRFNRNTTVRKDLVESMSLIGFKGAILVVLTKAFGGLKMFILDGQHRFKVVEFLEIPFNYEVMKLKHDTRENVVALMKSFNQTSHRWVNEVYLNNSVALGTKEYITFKNALEGTELQPTDLQYIFGVTPKEFRSGEMKFKDEKESLRLLNSMSKIVSHLPRFAYCRRAIFQLLNDEKTKIDHKVLAELILKEVKIMAKKGEGFSSEEKVFKAEIQKLIKDNSKLLKMAA